MFKSWIPNSLSLGNLLFGFAAIVIAAKNSESLVLYKQIIPLCCVLIVIAALLDGFDGFIARLLKVESNLGEHLDTLADMTAFGIAPGFLAYFLFFQDLNYVFLGIKFPLGILLAAVYPMCAAYRLARFSVAHDKYSFVGLPSPMGAALLIFFLFLFPFDMNPWFVSVEYLFISFLMVSNIKYTKPQTAAQEHINLGRLTILFVLFALVIYFWGWYWVFFGVLFLYTFSGFLSIIFGLIQKIRIKIG